MEQKRKDLLNKYWSDIKKDFFNEEGFCPEFTHLCIEADPEFAVKVLESLYGKNKLEILTR